MAMKPLSLFLFLFFFFHLSSGFLGFWGGEEEEKEKSVFEELWLNIPPRYHTQIFEKLKADPSFSSLIKFFSFFSFLFFFFFFFLPPIDFISFSL